MPLQNQFPAPFVVNPKRAAIAISYKNGQMIADAVLPRVQVDTPSFYYSLFNKSDSFTVPETKVGRTSQVNQVDWHATQQSATVQDHALEEVIPRLDQAIASSYGVTNMDPKDLATQQISDLLELSHEARTAAITFNPNSYASTNKTTLASTTQWSDFTNSDPLNAILTAKDGMQVTPNKLVIGQKVWTTLRRHPKLNQAYNKDSGQYGALSREAVAELLEIDEILVGEAWVNGAVKGQSAPLSRLWGNHAALIYSAPVTFNTTTPTFGITAQWGTRIEGEYFDENKGMRGSDVVRVGESVQELVLASDMGYFFQNAVA